MKTLLAMTAALFLAACAAYGGLKPGEARLDDVIRTLGQPAMRWQDPDGSVQLAYPHGPMGVTTDMVYIGPDGRLKRIENVMDEDVFPRVQTGMTKEQVLRILGPSYPGWTVYFKARNELVWEWRYCSDNQALSRFDVMFDGTTGVVRRTQSQIEWCKRGPCMCYEQPPLF